MCGIAGIVTAGKGAPGAREYRDRVVAMTARLTHRGPDGEGFATFERAALGHRRLRVVDLETGDQPLLDHGGRRALVFNGEIYGYRELRRSLESVYPFRTHSDTEVILALLDRDPARALESLTGMFAFALWDDDAGTLTAARDPFGEKPFYYAFGPRGEFVFASEIKALLSSGLIVPKLDPKALAFYLSRLYIEPGESAYENVHVLPPGCVLRWAEGTLSVERYWSPPATDTRLTWAAACERFRELLGNAVRRQLVADVPVGVFLSGGLDSSTLVALASRLVPRITTIAFGFESGVDELPYAREVAERYGTDHIEIRESEVDVPAALFEMAAIYDEPFGDSSNIPTFLISREVRKHLTVVLGGEGSDELLAGYTFWYRSLLGIGGLVRRLRHGTLLAAHLNGTAYFTAAELSALGLPAPPTATAGDGRSHDAIEDVLRWDAEHYLPGDILVKGDRASMANGLELRAPFLDRPFAEFCLSLPGRFKIDRNTDKKILRECFSAAWPPSVRTRPKQGFGAPVDQWLRKPEVRSLADEYLGRRGRKIFDLLDEAAVRRFAARGNYQTWALLVLSLWLERSPEPSHVVA